MSQSISSDFSRQLDKVRSQGAVLIACLLLSLDSINPIKVICGIIGIPTVLVAYTSFLLLLYMIVSYFSELCYFGVRIFFTSILSIFFAKNNIIGKSNIPRDGPIIFTGNHANQFVDALQVMTNCGHKVGFLIAKKSFDHTVVGFFARILGCIPVSRPQDSAVTMPPDQVIWAEGSRIYGRNTKFKSQLKPKVKNIESALHNFHRNKYSYPFHDKIRFRGQSQQLIVEEIVSDTEVVIVENLGNEFKNAQSEWDMLHYIDQSTVFDGVYEALRSGQCMGIFPEGGSHDRTDLLPLKVGVAVIAFGMLERHNILVPIVPIGLNYYRGHRFRGRAVVEFGPPIRISPELYELYQRNKREAYTELLFLIEGSMRSCIVTVPDYKALKLVYTARRLYQPSQKILSPETKQDMNRRFAEGYKILLKRFSTTVSDPINTSPSKVSQFDEGQLSALEGDLPPDAKQLKQHLEEYQQRLSKLGLRDYQVPTLAKPYPLKATFIILHLLFVSLLAAIPALILNAPVGLVSRKMAESERKRALEGSVVKITGRDVMMSKKIIISIVMVPALWLTYAMALCLFTDLQADTKALIILCMPLFSYVGVMATEAGMIDAKDLKPMLMRLRPEVRREMLTLPAFRSSVQRELRNFVARHGPSLGDIYNKTEPLNWKEQFTRNPASKTKENIELMAKKAVSVMETDSADCKKEN